MKKGLFFLPVVIVIGLFLFITRDEGGTDTKNDLEEVLSTEDDDESKEDNPLNKTEVIVDVKGEVQKPGVYEFSTDSRVNDVIQKAGGFTDEADETQVNLAQKVHDEMIIIIMKTDRKSTRLNSSHVAIS